MLIKSEYLNVKYYFSRGEFYVGLDRSLFYKFLLKQDEIKNYLKNTPKRLILNYEKKKIYKRSTRESLKLREFLSEMDKLTNLKISFPKKLDLAISVSEILKEVQSFVGMEFGEKTCPDIFHFIFKKFILGFPSKGDHLAAKVLKTIRKVDIFLLEFKTWVRVAKFVRSLKPAWPNMKYFYFEANNKTLCHYQTFTDINLCSPLTKTNEFSFQPFQLLERQRIFMQVGQKVPVHLLSLANKREPMFTYDEFLIRKRIPHDTVSPFDSKVDFSDNQFQLTALPENYFIFNNNGLMFDDEIRAANLLRNHYKLAVIRTSIVFQSREKFNCTIDQLHLRNWGNFEIKFTLDLFLNVKKIILYLDSLECLSGLASENFIKFESITVYIKQDCLIECIKSLNSSFETLKIEKAIAPIVASDFMYLDEAFIYEKGWKLLKPTSYAELYQQIGETIQENIVRE